MPIDFLYNNRMYLKSSHKDKKHHMLLVVYPKRKIDIRCFRLLPVL